LHARRRRGIIAGSFARPLGEQQLTAVMTLLLLLLAMLVTLMMMMMMVRMMVVRGGRGRRAGRGRLMVTQVVPAGRQVQVEAGGRRVLAAARLGARRIAAVARFLVGRQAHRRLR